MFHLFISILKNTYQSLFHHHFLLKPLAFITLKTKEYSTSELASKVKLADDAPDVTHVMAYMFAGAGAAAIVVIFLTLALIKKHDRKKDKLGGIQGMTGAESCTKDYQDLCRARMAKGNTNESTTGRIASLSKESEVRPPSSRSSTSSW